jgi:hypothetical protein
MEPRQSIWHIEHTRHKYCHKQLEIHSLKNFGHFANRKKYHYFAFLVEKLKENGTETRIWHIEHPRHKYCLGQVEIHSLKSLEHFVERKIPIFRVLDWKPK